jgi:hypothetical protein
MVRPPAFRMRPLRVDVPVAEYSGPAEESEYGEAGVVVPIPTCPFEFTMKAVDVAVADEVAMSKSGRLESDDVAASVRTARGEVVPIPTRVAPAV